MMSSKQYYHYSRKEKQVAVVAGGGVPQPQRDAMGWDRRAIPGAVHGRSGIDLCVLGAGTRGSGAQGPLRRRLGPGLGSCSPVPLLPVLRTSLTSSTFSSSRVGSSTIPGMTAAAATPARRPQPLRPRLLELPLRPPWPSLRMRIRGTQAHCCARRERRSVRKARKSGACAKPGSPARVRGGASRGTQPLLLVVIVRWCPQWLGSQRLEARSGRHGVHRE